MSPLALMAWVHYTLPREESFNVALSDTHWDLFLKSAIWEQDENGEEGIAQYKSMKTPLEDHMWKPEKFKYGCYRLLSDTRAEWIASAIGVDVLYAQKLLIPETSGRSLITGNDFPLENAADRLEYHSGKNLGYFLIANGTERCTILAAPGG